MNFLKRKQAVVVVATHSLEIYLKTWWSLKKFGWASPLSFSAQNSQFTASASMSLLTWIIVKLVDKTMQSNYSCFSLHVKRKKILTLTVFTWLKKPRWRPCLVTSQTTSSATNHKIYLILERRSKAFHWRQKNVPSHILEKLLSLAVAIKLAWTVEVILQLFSERRKRLEGGKG